MASQWFPETSQVLPLSRAGGAAGADAGRQNFSQTLGGNALSGFFFA
jgi:hypothetical protein